MMMQIKIIAGKVIERPPSVKKPIVPKDVSSSRHNETIAGVRRCLAEGPFSAWRGETFCPDTSTKGSR
jgi:hypothetical protein